MALYKIQGKAEKRKGVYYEFDSDDEPLGEGGMGKVYKGRCVDESTGRSKYVAVKFMYSDLSEYAIEKARREAAIQIRHNNLIEMLGFIETESKSVLGETMRHYHVVSELLEGVNLDKLFEGKLVDQQGNFVPFAEKLFKDYRQDPIHFAVNLAKNILSGLMMLHDSGYIHRDISPDNIMLTSDGRIKLIDFGIAKQMKSLTTHDKHLTREGQFVGKPEYAAPELILGEINEQNQTTDIYAVGILLYQCIVGHLPFEGDRSDIIQKQIRASLPLKKIKHKELRKIIEKATQKSRAKRYQSAAEFRVDLERIDSSGRGGLEWKKAYTYSIVGGVAACLVVVIGLYLNSQASVSDNSQTSASEVVQEESGMAYSSAIANLHDTDNMQKGVNGLEKLSQQGNADATFLLSRLYFKSAKENDSRYYCPDSIIKLQQAQNVPIDNAKAHDLLHKALKQDPTNYQALYELACDYWRCDERVETLAYSEELRLKSKDLFLKAKKYAHENNDAEYEQSCDAYLNRFEEWLKK